MSSTRAASPSATAATRATGTIGQPGEPVRVLAFASGGLETARQLGVTHALLVSRGRAPDMVIGSSAGAINAVALAEILQAGGAGGTAQEQALARTARFREIFEAYQNCPTDLADEMLPDAYQIDVQRPLEQLRLPVHSELERGRRGEHLQSRAGILNLYNDLLRLRISIATATRFIRRFLGWKAMGAEANRVKWFLGRALELLRAWALIGYHLLELAPITSLVVRAAFGKRPRELGASAAHLIFQSRSVRRGAQLVSGVFWLAVLATLWMALSTLILIVGAPIGYGIAWVVNLVPLPPEPAGCGLLATAATLDSGCLRHYGAVLDRYLYLAVLGILCVSLVAAVVSAALRKTSRVGEFRAVMGSALGFLGLYVGTAVLARRALLGLASLPAGSDLRTLLYGGVVLVAALIVLTIVVGAIAIGMCASVGHLGRNLLKRYDLANGLGSNYPLRQLFVRLFDRAYYGPPDMDTVLERAMAYSDAEHDKGEGPDLERTPSTAKRLAYYAARERVPPIHVAVTVANVGAVPGAPDDPLLIILPGDTTVVGALLAATAVTPYLPPVSYDQRLYLDAANVANEPTAVALNYLRGAAHPTATEVHLYSVTHLPLTAANLAHDAPERYGELLNVALRARELERFRDARLDRTLTDLFSDTMPPGTVHYRAGSKSFLRARVFPVEPDAPGHVNAAVLQARSAADRRRIIAETVADGCRAALERMTPAQVRQGAGGKPTILCRAAITQRLHGGRPDATGGIGIPGSSSRDEDGPGIVEVCSNCALNRKSDRPEEQGRCTLRVVEAAAALPEWPGSEPPPPPPVRPPPQVVDLVAPGPRAWPEARVLAVGGQPERSLGHERPTVSLLFSGGVFRGVYQMGVLNALNEAGLRPDIIAGASVGSITAAMIARVFGEPNALDRHARIARLAAVYLGIDRLVMTDRFADFIRAVTVRAAQTEFSIRDADRVFRRYDAPLMGAYEREVRLVIAGLERLCYISPFELKDLVEALRRQDYATATARLTAYAQEWLNRLGVSNQVLGAEALRLLITHYVRDGLAAQAGMPEGDARFDVFREKGICFLATMTNLTGGRLEVLGEGQLRDDAPTESLVDGLLASSAFPGVFRPRWSWEVRPGSHAKDRYIDGGVMDNLPLDAVAAFLHRAAQDGWVARRPRLGDGVKAPYLDVPHLLVATSLEPELAPPDDLGEYETNWLRLRPRAKQLKYNYKLDTYAEAQRDLRTIVAARGPAPGMFTPLDLEVLAIKPQWLCPTFGFHPMMGFTRKRQAESIAHGCRTTLLKLGRLYHGSGRQPGWANAWGLDPTRLPGEEVFATDPPPVKLPDAKGGMCWIRPKTPCPFSRQAATKALGESAVPGNPLRVPTTLAELDKIYHCCGTEAAHRRKDK